MQMGGGDSLYDKIDKGIRGCKVVISCVTSKYALSANCRREVSLADAIKKPIVPLLLEKNSTWPPPGPMSMVFTQLLYIDFCCPDEGVQNHWDCPQMEQLYGKLAEYVPNVVAEESKRNEGDSKQDDVPDDKGQVLSPKENGSDTAKITQNTNNADEAKRESESGKESTHNKQNVEKIKSQPDKAVENEKPQSKSCTIL